MTILVLTALVSAVTGILAVASRPEPAPAKVAVLTEEGKRISRR